MGMSAPKLLTSPISIPLPAVIRSMFPICASVAKSSPASARLVASAGTVSSLTLGSSVAIKDDAPVSTFVATVSAAADVFPEGAEVR
jgi:hypothetical protein